MRRRARPTPAIDEHYRRAVGTPDERVGCATLPGQTIGATRWLGDL